MPAAAALDRASSSISSVMSRPIARPLGATRRALISTSAPAPEPRSRTTSPSRSSATAVGTPQPSEACAGAPSASGSASYSEPPKTSLPSLSSRLTGAQHAGPAEVPGPQQDSPTGSAVVIEVAAAA